MALTAGRSAQGFLDAQRVRHLAAMRELTAQRQRTVRLPDQLALDYHLFHIEADLRWIDHAEARLAANDEPVHDITGTVG